MPGLTTRRQFLSAVGAASGGLLLAACLPAAPSAPTPSTSSAPAVAKTRGGTLTIDAAAFVGLDPNLPLGIGTINLLKNIAEPLLYYDTTFKLLPRLATAWKVGDDGATWTFDLRKGVTFHDGTPFDAEAVKANFQRWIDPKATSYSVGVFTQTFDSIEIVDPATVRIKTKGRQATMPGAVALIGSEIISPKQLATPEAITRGPIGTGPFKVETFIPSETLALVRNESYWGEKALLDRAVYKTIGEPSAKAAALLTGQVDLTLTFPATQLASISSQSGLRTNRVTTSLVHVLQPNTKRAPFDRVEVRRALATALDMGALIKTGYLGVGETMDGFLPPTLHKTPGLPTIPRADPTAAREQLRQAGLADLTFTLHFQNTPDFMRISQLLQEQWRQAGVTVELQSVDFPTLLGIGGKGDFDAMIGSAGSLHGHVLSHVVRTFDPAPSNLLNFGRYTTPQIEALLKQLAVELDEAKQRDLIDQIAKIWVADVPYLYGVNVVFVDAMRDSVQDLNRSPAGDYDLAAVWKRA